MPNFYEKVKFFADFLITHELKKGIHPRPCGIMNLSNIISYGRGTLPYLIEADICLLRFLLLIEKIILILVNIIPEKKINKK